jgi:hypothetical protein
MLWMVDGFVRGGELLEGKVRREERGEWVVDVPFLSNREWQEWGKGGSVGCIFWRGRGKALFLLILESKHKQDSDLASSFGGLRDGKIRER